MSVLFIALLVIAVSAAIHAAVGFGINLLAVPVLLLLDSAYVPGPALVAGLFLSLLMAGREFGSFDHRLGWAVLGLLPGTALALGLLAVVPQDALGAPLGLLVLVAVGLSALRWKPSPTRPALLAAGTASGFLATAASIGGPPMALLYASAEGARLRSTLSVFFVAASILSIGSLTAVGRLGPEELKVSAAFLPAVAVGFLLAGPLRRIVDRGHARPAVLVLSALAAVAAVLQSFLRG